MTGRVIVVIFLVFTVSAFAGEITMDGLILIGQNDSCGDFLHYNHTFETTESIVKKIDENKSLWEIFHYNKRLLFCDKKTRETIEQFIATLSTRRRGRFEYLLSGALNVYELDESETCKKLGRCNLANEYIHNATLGRVVEECTKLSEDCLRTRLAYYGLPEGRVKSLAKMISQWDEAPDVITLASMGVDRFSAVHPAVMKFFERKIKKDSIENGLFLSSRKNLQTLDAAWMITLKFSDLEMAAININYAFEYSTKHKTKVYVTDYANLAEVMNSVSENSKNKLTSVILSWARSQAYSLKAWESSLCIAQGRSKINSYAAWLLVKREMLDKDERLEFDFYVLNKLSGCPGDSGSWLDMGHTYLSEVIMRDISKMITPEQLLNDKAMLKNLALLLFSNVHEMYPVKLDGNGCVSKFLSDIHYLNPQGGTIVKLIMAKYDELAKRKEKPSFLKCEGTFGFL
ncbi:hypothetical protein [Pseudaeromonas paramecii]|uniref:Uncharacterized protein n=1 Tax=Pseudaeromonas paramecii TaxID=2138166 RepID=A0ABP8Q3B4_9GAMM